MLVQLLRNKFNSFVCSIFDRLVFTPEVAKLHTAIQKAYQWPESERRCHYLANNYYLLGNQYLKEGDKNLSSSCFELSDLWNEKAERYMYGY